MLRPTKSEIEAEIIDRASGLFAQHGFAHASLQQIADAVGYSKAGLLHHFPSKQAVYDAAIRGLRAHAEAMRDGVKDIPPGRERDKAVIEASVSFAFQRPGIAALGNRIALDPDPDDKEMNEIGFIMYQALGIDLARLDMERLIRVTSAFSGLGITAALAVRSKLSEEWKDLIIAAAMDGLGHRKD
ncbi:TetR/AcrR family transcriptional regulator [Ensifer canadensis]